MLSSNTSTLEISLFVFGKHIQILTLIICLYMWLKAFLVKVGQRGSNTFYDALKAVVGGLIKTARTP